MQSCSRPRHTASIEAQVRVCPGTSHSLQNMHSLQADATNIFAQHAQYGQPNACFDELCAPQLGSMPFFNPAGACLGPGGERFDNAGGRVPHLEAGVPQLAWAGMNGVHGNFAHSGDGVVAAGYDSNMASNSDVMGEGRFAGEQTWSRSPAMASSAEPTSLMAVPVDPTPTPQAWSESVKENTDPVAATAARYDPKSETWGRGAQGVRLSISNAPAAVEAWAGAESAAEVGTKSAVKSSREKISKPLQDFLRAGKTEDARQAESEEGVGAEDAEEEGTRKQQHQQEEEHEEAGNGEEVDEDHSDSQEGDFGGEQQVSGARVCALCGTLNDGSYGTGGLLER